MSVALHFIQYLQDNGIGTIQDDLWYGELPLYDQYETNIDAIAVVESGGGLFRKQAYDVLELDIWGRGANGKWPIMAERLQAIIDLLKSNCCPELPIVASGCCPDDGHTFDYIYMKPLSGVENLGTDSEHSMLYRVRVQIKYKKG